ncbi:MAG: hypothetical protein MK193_03995 [Lentisphaeria bacterium]|nr:hypothetical protein [Lentisphaeria bacterium]
MDLIKAIFALTLLIPITYGQIRPFFQTECEITEGSDHLLVNKGKLTISQNQVDAIKYTYIISFMETETREVNCVIGLQDARDFKAELKRSLNLAKIAERDELNRKKILKIFNSSEDFRNHGLSLQLISQEDGRKVRIGIKITIPRSVTPLRTCNLTIEQVQHTIDALEKMPKLKTPSIKGKFTNRQLILKKNKKIGFDISFELSSSQFLIQKPIVKYAFLVKQRDGSVKRIGNFHMPQRSHQVKTSEFKKVSIKYGTPGSATSTYILRSTDQVIAYQIKLFSGDILLDDYNSLSYKKRVQLKIPHDWATSKNFTMF